MAGIAGTQTEQWGLININKLHIFFTFLSSSSSVYRITFRSMQPSALALNILLHIQSLSAFFPPASAALSCLTKPWFQILIQALFHIDIKIIDPILDSVLLICSVYSQVGCHQVASSCIGFSSEIPLF